MGIWGTLTRRETTPSVNASKEAVSQPAHRFAIGSDYATWTALVGGHQGAKVSRAEALGVPACKRARDLVCSTIATLPLHAINNDGEQVLRSVLEQPESHAGIVRSVTISRTVDDLLFEGSALWLVVLRDSTGFPSVVERVEPGQWSQDSDTGTIRVRGREVPLGDAILFVSPNDPLLVTGASAIRTLRLLERAAVLYAETPEPASYFTSIDGQDPSASEVQEFLSDWASARRSRATGYVPAGVELKSVDRLTPEEMALTAAREFGVTEIARLTGIDATWLSVNVTTRTYSNITSERRSFVDFTIGPFLQAVEQRLSLNDFTPNGQKVRFNLNAFLRADTAERYASYTAALAGGWLTLDEIRELENRPSLTAPPSGDTP